MPLPLGESKSGGDAGHVQDHNDIHAVVNDVGDLSTLTNEASPAAGDLFLMERASDGARRKVTSANLPGGAAGGGIFDYSLVLNANDYIDTANTAAQNDSGITSLKAAMADNCLVYFEPGAYKVSATIDFDNTLMGFEWYCPGGGTRTENGPSNPSGAIFVFDIDTANRLITYNESATSLVKEGPKFTNIHITVETPGTQAVPDQQNKHTGFYIEGANNYTFEFCTVAFMAVGFDTTNGSYDNSYWRFRGCDTLACTIGWRQRSSGAGYGLISDCRYFLLGNDIATAAIPNTIAIDHADEIAAVTVEHFKIHGAGVGVKSGSATAEDGGKYIDVSYEALSNTPSNYTAFDINGRNTALIRPRVNGQSGGPSGTYIDLTGSLRAHVEAPPGWVTQGSSHTSDTWVVLGTETTGYIAGYPILAAHPLPEAEEKESGFFGVAMTAKAGVPADADFPHTPPNQTTVWNSSNNTLYYRKSGTWTAHATGASAFQPSHEAISTNSTITATELGYVTLTAGSITATLPTSPTAGDTYTVVMKAAGTSTFASGTSGDFWFQNVTADTYTLASYSARVTVFWDGTHWVVVDTFGVVS
jgi:hypothetical protein